MSRGSRTSPIIREAAVLGAAVLLLGALTWPLLFTYSGFGDHSDWMHDLWLVWHQSLSIQSSQAPSFFLNTSYSVFNPTYAFYGGTLYALTGALSLVLGGAPVAAYVLTYLLDFAAAFGGWYWLARMAGVGRWLATVPSLIYITSAYYMLVIYVQGDWPESTGISMLPLMAAAGLSVMRADRLRLPAAFALAASGILFFGSHNVTIMLGLSMIAVTAIAVAICVPNARRQVTLRGVARVAGVLVPAALVSAWYLLPTLAYESRTRIGGEYDRATAAVRDTSKLVSFGHLFTLSRASARTVPSPYPFALSLPVLAIIWVLAGILILPWGKHRSTWTRLLLICSGMALVITVMMTHVGLLLALPRPYGLIQFSYRLENYVLLALCGAILAALVPAGRASRRTRVWRLMAIPVCAVSLVAAIRQISAFPYPGQDRYGVLRSYGQIYLGNIEDYQDVSAPMISGQDLPTVDIPLNAVHSDRASLTVHARPGTLVATNIAAGSYLVHVAGATPVGVDSQTDDMVLRIGAGNGARAVSTVKAPSTAASIPTETISVSAGDSLPVALGRLLTLAGLVILVLQLVALPARRLLAQRVRVSDPARPVNAAQQ
jgi:hypothetical protein